MKGHKEYITTGAEETRALAQQIHAQLQPSSVVALFGDLGSGKTTFVQGMAPQEEVCSPTYSYLHIYAENFYHFDLYRLLSADDFIALGFQEYFEAGGICCIEWPEKIAFLLPDRTIRIFFSHTGGDGRTIVVEK